MTNLMHKFLVITSLLYSSKCFAHYILIIRRSKLKPATQIPPQPATPKLPTHIETRTHNQCGDTTEKSQAPDDGCINVRNMLSIEEVK